MSADVKEMAVCVKENSTTREWKKNVKIIMGWGQEKDTFVITQSPYLGIIGRDVILRSNYTNSTLEMCLSNYEFN